METRILLKRNWMKYNLIDTIAIYILQQGANFYGLMRRSDKPKIKKSFFYEKNDENKDKIKEKYFNLVQEQVLYLSIGVLAICLKEVNCSKGDEFLLIKYELKEEIQLCDFSFRAEKITEKGLIGLSKKVFRQDARWLML